MTLCVCLLLCKLPVGPNDYVHLGCVGDVVDKTVLPLYDWPRSQKLALESFLFPVIVLPNDQPLNRPTDCASAAKRVGKRFFGLTPYSCRAGSSLISALRHSAKPALCDNLCDDEGSFTCREDGGGGNYDIPSTSLYVLKAAKGECLFLPPAILCPSGKEVPAHCKGVAAWR